MNKRIGIPHFYSFLTKKGNLTPSLSQEQFINTTLNGVLHINRVTEKTDGQSFTIGYDGEFYTQHTGSGDFRARSGSHHIQYALDKASKAGKEIHHGIYAAFSVLHDALATNKSLIQYLENTCSKYGDIVIKGECFNKFAQTGVNARGHVKFVQTHYDPIHMGHIGLFVVHSQLWENGHLDGFPVDSFNTDLIKFDTDLVELSPLEIGVSEEVNECRLLNFKLHHDKTFRFNEIKKRIFDRVEPYFKDIAPKWGQETEGYVVHPCDLNPDATRFKLISDSFLTNKGLK